MGKYSLIPQPDRIDPDTWSKNTCCNRRCGAIDLIKVLIAGYRQLYMPNWTHCLSQKWSIGDCVAGCHNEHIDLLHSQYRHSHQSRLHRRALVDATKALVDSDKKAEAEASDVKYEDFEQLYEDVRADLTDVVGINDITIYDTALRIAWNKEAKAEAEKQLTPKKYVYLHCGAMKGAKSLREVSKLLNTNFFVYEGNLPYRVELTCFRKDLQDLGAQYVEDFLCVFHPILGHWAEGLKRDVKKKKEKDKRKRAKEQKKIQTNKAKP